MSAYATLISDAQRFCAELKENNTKAWFADHKARYEAELKRPALMLLDEVAAELAKDYETPFTTKLFRIHRDVRFSKDKSPYNAHLHMLWSQTGRADGPGWFFGISPDYVRIGWGWMVFSKDQLTTWRQAIDGPYGAGIDKAIMAMGMEPNAPELKRVPTPHDKDHPLAHHLRRKSLVVWSNLGAGAALKQELISGFAQVKPLYAELDDLMS